MAAKLGSGARFSGLRAELASRGARNPSGLAASIGRRKYGAQRYAQLAARGRKRKMGVNRMVAAINKARAT